MLEIQGHVCIIHTKQTNTENIYLCKEEANSYLPNDAD